MLRNGGRSGVGRVGGEAEKGIVSLSPGIDADTRIVLGSLCLEESAATEIRRAVVVIQYERSVVGAAQVTRGVEVEVRSGREEQSFGEGMRPGESKQHIAF